MALRKDHKGRLRPSGFWCPELSRPLYRALKALEQVTGADTKATLEGLIQFAAFHWQQPHTRQQLADGIRQRQSAAVAEAEVYPIMPLD